MLGRLKSKPYLLALPMLLLMIFVVASLSVSALDGYAQIITVRRTLCGVTETLTVYDEGWTDDRTVEFDEGSGIQVCVYVAHPAGGGPPFYLTFWNSEGYQEDRTISDYYECVYPYPVEGDYRIYVDGTTPGTFYVEAVMSDLTASTPRPDDGAASPPFCVGQTVDWYVTVTNGSSCVEADSSDVGYYLGTSSSDFGDRICSDSTGDIPAPGSQIEHCAYTFQSGDAGTRYLNVWADYDNDVNEESESNNKNSYGPFQVLPILPAPTLSSPANGTEYCSGDSVSLCWADMSGADSYNIEVSTTSDFASVIWVDTTPSTCTSYDAMTTGTLYWRVRAHNDCDWGAFSGSRNFVVRAAPSAAPSLSAPPDGYQTCDTTPEFSWGTVADADTYHIQIDNNSDFTSPEAEQSNATSPYVPPALAPDTYYWRVRAANACNVGPWSLPARIVTILSAPDAPGLQSPADGYETCGDSVSLSWATVAGATSYYLQVDDDPAFGSPEVNNPNASTPYVTPALPAGTYYWRVRASNDCGDGSWSSPLRSFTLNDPPSAPSLSAPADGYETCDASVMLSWSAVSGATSYRLQVDDDPLFGSPEVNDPSASSPYATPALARGTYYWRVLAANDCGEGDWSSPNRSFTVNGAPESAPSLVSPADGYKSCEAAVQLSWQPVVGATSYHLQLDDSSTFSSPQVDEPDAVSPFTTPSLSPDTYYWRVRASNSCGDGPWSSPNRQLDILNPTVTAVFTATPTIGTVPLPVTFFNQSLVAEPQSWLWDFGDGGQSTEFEPTYTYIEPGLWDVTLTVTGTCGVDEAVRLDYIDAISVPVEITQQTVSNVRDASFTVSWLTEPSSNGYIDYGTTTALGSRADDVRGSLHTGTTHYVQVTGLEAETTYYFDIVSGSTRDDNGGAHYTVTTGPTLALPASDAAYGLVYQEDGVTPAEGAIVLIWLMDNDGSGDAGTAALMSSLTDESGYWYTNLGNARLPNLSGYFQYSLSGDSLYLEATGGPLGDTCLYEDTGSDSPSADMVLGDPCQDDGILNLSVDLQGRFDDSGTLFTAWSGGGQAGSCTSASDGTCSISLPTGVYSVTAVMSLYLDSTWDSVTINAGSVVDLPTVVLRGGDTNDDCVINILDLSFIGYRFNTCEGDPLYDVRGDINADGCINILDLTMAGGNYMKECPVPWPAADAATRAPTPALAQVALDPAELEVLTGSTGDMDISVTGATDLYGASVTLTFDPAVVEVVDADGNAGNGVQIALSDDLLSPDFVASNIVSNTAGTIDFAITQLAPSLPSDGDGVLAIITFRGLAEGTSAVAFGEVILADSDGAQIPADVSGGVVNVTEGYMIYLPLVLR